MVVRLNLGILRFANLHTGLGGLYYEPAYLLTVFDGQWIWGQCLKGIFSKGVFVCQDMLISQPKWLWQWWSWMLNGSVYGGVDLVIVIVATILMILTMFVMVEDEKSEYALVFHHELSRITYVCIFIYIYRIILYIYISIFVFPSCELLTLNPPTPVFAEEQGCFHLLWCLTAASWRANLCLFGGGRNCWGVL